jgi:hypothetical protein
MLYLPRQIWQPCSAALSCYLTNYAQSRPFIHKRPLCTAGLSHNGQNYSLRNAKITKWRFCCCWFCIVKTRRKSFKVLVNVAGFNTRLNWTNSCEWLNVFTNAGHLFICSTNKRSALKTWNSTYKKILEQTGTGEWTNVDKWLCIVMGGGLSIGKFYNRGYPFSRLRLCINYDKKRVEPLT